MDLGFKDLVEALVPVFQMLTYAGITALAGFIAAWLKRKWNIQVDSDMRDALDKTLANVAGSLIAKGAVKIEGTKVHVPDGIMAEAIQDVLNRATDAAKHFNLSQADADHLAERLLSKIAQMPGTPSVPVPTVDK